MKTNALTLHLKRVRSSLRTDLNTGSRGFATRPLGGGACTNSKICGITATELCAGVPNA